MVGGVWALASAIGPLLGGVFTEKVTWRWCFYINLPLDGAAFFIILFFLNNLHTPRTPLLEGLKAIDWLGSVTIIGGTLMLLFGLEFGGGTHPWNSATVICLIVFGVLTIMLFALNEWRIAPYPIIPLHIFRYRSNLACLAVCFCHGFTFIGASYYLPLYFQACLGAPPLLSGVYTISLALSLSFASMATGMTIRKTGQYLPPIYAGLAIMTLGVGLLTNLDAHSSWAKIILYQIVTGIGVGPLFQAPLIALQSLIPPRDIAAGTSTFQFTRNISTAISVVIGGVVFQNTIKSHQAQLIASLGPASAAKLAGFNAGANVGLIKALPPAQREVAREIFAAALHNMWIMYVCVAAVGLFMSFLITRQLLKKEHETTKTGMAVEKEKRAEREERRRSRKSIGSPTSPTFSNGVGGAPVREKEEV
jgi:MFS family permease